jgi:hypothetical protein
VGGLAQGEQPWASGEQPHDSGGLDGMGGVFDGHTLKNIVQLII